jgi:hypothetical protein
MKVLERVARALRDLGSPFALIGGRAIGIRGYPRATFDFDFLTSDPAVLRPASWQELAREGVAVDCRRGDLDDPVAGVVRLRFADGGRADVLLARSAWEQGVIERAEVLTLAGTGVPVARTADLILLKLAAGGAVDVQDVVVLLGLGGREELVAEIDRRVGDLPAEARALWDRVEPETRSR